MIDLNNNSTVLYYSPKRYEEYQVGNRVLHFGRTIQILGRVMRHDLDIGFGPYFEIRYRYEY